MPKLPSNYDDGFPAYLLLYASVRSILLLAIIVTVCSLGVRYFNRPFYTISTIADNSYYNFYYYIYLLHLFFVSIFPGYIGDLAQILLKRTVQPSSQGLH